MWKAITYSSDHFNEMVWMAQEQYGIENDIANAEFLQHQYFKNPAGEALIDLAWDEENNALAGQYIVWPQKFFCKGKNIPCVNSLNTLTKREYRGQGIFTGLANKTYSRAASAGDKFCYGVPNPNSYPGFIKKLHFKKVCDLPLLLRPLCLSRMTAEYFNRPVLKNILKPVNCLFGISGKETKYQFCEIKSENLQLVDEFWKTVCGKYSIMNVRDSAHVRFRYLEMPRRQYYPYVAMYQAKPVCFAVGRIMEVAGMQCAMLADFLFQDGFEDAAKSLIRHMLVQLKKQGASLAGCLMLEHTQEYKVLKKLGFIRCPKKLEPQPFPLLVRRFDESIAESELVNSQNWFFTMGDYDVI
ncbi:GNAT family N-acetyltransferase [Agathobaculum sp. Marseille-P7918]|uniref:GNAT family N-acetyltransferase n=1 Tax=Agathobaculum sp. Marseille-P7918 TaxID=2479843 RepID=UPI000F63A174|nr:GNAT family N-acetyltransferase [Agathobaculum sp. Marseille-P7918]